MRQTRSTHLWTAPLPANLEPGAHVITAAATDEYGQAHEARVIFEIED